MPIESEKHVNLVEERGVVYGYASGRDLLLDVLSAPQDDGLLAAVVYVHGGGWAYGDRAMNPQRILAEAGFFTVSISYRLSDVAPHPAQIHDVKAAIRWVRAHAEEYGVDPARIGIWGHSAGGHLSALAATTNDDPAYEGSSGNAGYDSSVQCAIPMSPPLDCLIDWFAVQGLPMHPDSGVMADMLGASQIDDPAIARAASPLWQVKRGMVPQLIIHGEEDDLVPISQARAYVSSLRHHGQPQVELVALPGLGHDADAGTYPDNPDPFGLKPLVIEFFRTHLQ